jgi:hypothetical protein
MPWKLYVDSRKRIAGARGDTDSDFSIRLPYPITIRDRFYCDVCLFSNSFYSIRAGDNDRIYLDELAAQTKRVTLIAPGQYNAYTLRDALVAALNTGRGISGQYRVTYLEVPNRFSIDIVNPATTDVFRIWTDAALHASPAEWTSFAAPDALQTANRPCGFLSGPHISGDNLTIAQAPGAPDTQPYKQLFLRSSLGGGSNESLGPNGECDIIRRLVCGNTPLNALVHDAHATPFDFVTINGAPEVSTMWFQLIDIDGRVVDTHGHSLSFSIIFQDVTE